MNYMLGRWDGTSSNQMVGWVLHPRCQQWSGTAAATLILGRQQNPIVSYPIPGHAAVEQMAAEAGGGGAVVEGDFQPLPEGEGRRGAAGGGARR